jgi:hypothetical protein
MSSLLMSPKNQLTGSWREKCHSSQLRSIILDQIFNDDVTVHIPPQLFLSRRAMNMLF